jgi:hypothetical protein
VCGGVVCFGCCLYVLFNILFICWLLVGLGLVLVELDNGGRGVVSVLDWFLKAVCLGGLRRAFVAG